MSSLDRPSLKNAFKTGDIPTEADFANLIDSAINQADDGLSKSPDDPLTLRAAGPRQALLRFTSEKVLDSGTEIRPTWGLLHAPEDPAAGLMFLPEGGSADRPPLFIGADGRVGIGTGRPVAPLQVQGGKDAEQGTAHSGFLIIGDPDGLHLAIDDNEIMCKANATKGHDLSLQYNGGSTHVGGDLKLRKGASLWFANQTRQMINLWGDDYGIGIQSGTQYFRSVNRFAWHEGGSHADGALDPGRGGDLRMVLQDGKLGIATPKPITRLHVSGATPGTDNPVGLFEVANCGKPCAQPQWTESIRLWNRNTNGRVGLGLLVDSHGKPDTLPNAWLGTGDGASGSEFHVALRSGTSLKTRLLIEGATGHVGIGVSNPKTGLDVADYLIVRKNANNENVRKLLRGLPKNSLVIGGCWSDNAYLYWRDQTDKLYRALIKGDTDW